MTQDEARIIIGALKGAYVRETFTRERRTMLWRFLRDLPFPETLAVIEDQIATSKWCPTIAEIRRAVMEQRLSLPDAERAWDEVSRRSKLLAMHQEPPPWSHPALKDAVRRIGGMYAVGNARDGVKVRASFLKAYAEEREAALVDADRASRDNVTAISAGVEG